MSQVVTDFLNKKGWNYKQSGSENYSVKECPFCCDTKWHFYIHVDSGLWRCVKCEAVGNLYHLKCHLGDIKKPENYGEDKTTVAIDPFTVVDLQSKLVEGDSVWQYLEHRGFTGDTIRHFRLGSLQDATGAKWLALPYFDENGRCIDIKYRSTPPAAKTFRKEVGAKPCLFNQHSVNRNEGYIIVTEGETDCMAVWQMRYANVVSLPMGAGGLKPEFWDFLSSFPLIYLMTDNDTKGNESARKLAERIDPSRCRRAILPGCKDANQLLMEGGSPEQLKEILKQAKPMGAPVTYNVGNALHELSKMLHGSKGIEGPTFPWRNVSRIFGPMGGGEVTVILGAAGIGKTSYVLQTLLHSARKCQTPSLFMSLEMPVHRISQLMVAQITVCDRDKVLTKAHIAQVMAEMQGVPFYVSRRPDEISWESIRDSLLYAIRKFGVRLWAVDNLQFIARSESVVTEIGALSRNFKLLAEQTNTHAIIVSHPRKLQTNQQAGQYDAAWSHAIAADADHMHSIHRKEIVRQKGDTGESFSSYDDLAVINAAKSRYGEGGRTTLYFHGASGLFFDGKVNR